MVPLKAPRLDRLPAKRNNHWLGCSPYPKRFDLPKHIVKSIVRQAGLTNQEFFDLLDE
jgi:hypothetical protein